MRLKIGFAQPDLFQSEDEVLRRRVRLLERSAEDLFFGWCVEKFGFLP